ncbi:MAG: alkaline phosphatase family protein [Methanotrichaceae archaeon]
MILALFILLLLLSTGSALDVQVSEELHPVGAILLVVDGLGASYVYPERSCSPYAMDGMPLGKTILFNLTGDGARVLDMRARVPETLKSHSILVTGSTQADSESLGKTIFDVSHENGYLSLAILQHADFQEMLIRQDGVLYFANNSIYNAKASLSAGKNLPADLRTVLERWRDAFPGYDVGHGKETYIGYNRWGLEAASDLVDKLGNRSFILMINVAAVDSGGQNLGQKDYLEIVKGLDAPLGKLIETCRRHNVLLLVTADHGMSFPDEKGKGGHSASKFSDRLESLRMPLAIFGPGVDEIHLGGIWFEEDIAPTILDLLGLPWNISSSKPLPIKDSYDLHVTNASGEVSLYKDGKPIANASGDNNYIFKGLKRGLYTVSCGNNSLNICLNGEYSVNLAASASGNDSGNDTRKIIGIILIIAINTIGIIVIWRIIKKG